MTSHNNGYGNFPNLRKPLACCSLQQIAFWRLPSRAESRNCGCCGATTYADGGAAALRQHSRSRVSAPVPLRPSALAGARAGADRAGSAATGWRMGSLSAETDAGGPRAGARGLAPMPSPPRGRAAGGRPGRRPPTGAKLTVNHPSTKERDHFSVCPTHCRNTRKVADATGEQHATPTQETHARLA